MKFVVEVEDFWIDEDNLADSLQHRVINEVVRQIQDSIKQQVESLANDSIKTTIGESIQVRVDILLEEFVKSGKIRENNYKDSAYLTVVEWIAKYFKANNEVLLKYIKAQAEAQANEIKARYDLMFASQIVTKLNEQGMLKEDIAKLLLPNLPKE